MSDLSDAFDSTFRDYVTDGVPASGRHAPTKADARGLALEIQLAIDGVQGTPIPSATNIELWPGTADEGDGYLVSGTTTIASLTALSPAAGRRKWTRFQGVLTLTHSSSLYLGSAAKDIVTQADDIAEWISAGSNNIRLLDYYPPPALRTRSLAFASLPAVGLAGMGRGLVTCSDLGGGADLVTSDVTNHRRLGDHGAAAGSDAPVTLTPMLSAPYVDVPTLTADRTYTLSTTNAYNGCFFHITRGAGAFNLTVNPGALKVMPANSWAVFKYRAAWYLAAYGTL